MEVLEGIETRRSIRGFKPDPIPKDVINKILEAVSNTPSYTNTQPWEVVVVGGRKRDELSKIIFELAKTKASPNPDLPMPDGWPAEHQARSGEHGARRLATLGIERGDEEGRQKLNLMNYEFYGAPCVIFLFIDGSLGEWSIFDMGLFAQNLILAAHALGVESVLQASVTNYAPQIKKFLGVAESKKLVISIPLGYTDDKAKLNTYRSIKQKPAEFTKWCE
jgi:nitroreductase